MNRRSFLTRSATTAAALCALAPATSLAATETQTTRRRHRLGLATYSYWHFRDPKISIETVIEKAGALGFDGVDVLHRQMDIEEKAPLDAAGRSYLRKLKRLAFLNGVE